MNIHMVKPGSKLKLEAIDPNAKPGFEGGKQEGKKALEKLLARMDELQEMLYAEHKHRLLIVLQGIDTAGKDGTIRAVFGSLNPQGVRVASFKTPAVPELEHDYLWRVHQVVPRTGEIVVFNRSHYEDVLIVRVHSLVPKERWERRYRHINEFERLLVNEGTTILKFFLYIDKDEQKARFQERIDIPRKQWKFNPDDLKERLLWPQYIQAYEEMLNRTSTQWAPWYVVPANANWYRNLVVATTVVEALEKLNPQFPKPAGDYSKIVIE